MSSVPIYPQEESRPSEDPVFQVVDLDEADLEIPGHVRNVPVVWVDYNSHRALSRRVVKRITLDNFSLSFRGAVLLAACVCLATILGCHFLTRF